MVNYPLTTLFNIPSSCNDAPRTAYAYSGYATTGNRDPTVIQELPTTCFPSAFSTGITYSPGICPIGYSTAKASPGYLVSAKCCPSGFKDHSLSSYCTSTFSNSPLAVDVFCPSSSPCINAPTTISAGIVVATMYQVEFQSSDLIRFPSGYTPDALPPQTGTTTRFSSGTGSGSSTSKPSSALPFTVIIYIIIGVLIALCASCVSACLLIRRRARRRTERHNQAIFQRQQEFDRQQQQQFQPMMDPKSPITPIVTPAPPYVSPVSNVQPFGPAELGGVQMLPPEADGRPRIVHEISGRAWNYPELDASATQQPRYELRG